MRPLAAQCHLGLGRVWRRAGKVDAADPHLRAAGEAFRLLEAPAWVAKVEREISAGRRGNGADADADHGDPDRWRSARGR